MQELNTTRPLSESFPPDKYNLLYPSEVIMEVSKLQKISFETVKINPNLDGQEVFKIGSQRVGNDWVEKLSLSKTALERISHAAGIVYDPVVTGRLDMGDPKVIGHRVRGGLIKPDGSAIDATKTKVIDLYAIEKRQRFELEEKAKKGELDKGFGKNAVTVKWGTAECKEEIERRVMTYMVGVDEVKYMKAETGAYLRVIRSLLGLKPHYLKTELEKPFVVIRATTNIEFLLSQPEMRQAILEQALNSRKLMFGAPVPEQRALPSRVVRIEDTAVVDDDEREIDQALPVRTEPVAIPVQEPPVVTEKEYKASWLTNSAKERIEEIERLIKPKGFKPKEGKNIKTLAEMSAEEQVNYLWHLYNFKPTEPPKDLPY